MQLIETVSSSRFSLNGIQFYKNFLSVVYGDSIVIYNAYDRNDVRIEPIHYSQISVDGITYASAILLQEALIDVIYARNISGGGSAVWGGITGTLSSQNDLQTALDNKVDENTAITGATKTKITYDNKGLVTGGADATTADISDSTNKRYVTDAQLTILGNTSGTNSGNETTSTIGTLVNGATSATPNDTDLLPVVDTSVTKKLTLTNLKAFLKTYFDTLYQVVLVSGTNIKTINSNSILGSGDLVIKPDVRHIFAFNNTFAASTSWYALGRESASLYDLTNFVTTTYNGTTILEARCVKFPIPSNCKLKKAQIIYSTLATPVDLRVLYFENTSGTTNVLNQITIASLSLPITTNNTVTDFTTQDLTTQLNAGGYVTFALFNNNVSTGVMRNVMLILDFVQL